MTDPRQIIADALRRDNIDPVSDAAVLATADAVLDALKAAGYVIEQDWQPIEKAPKDGTRVLTICAGEGEYPSVSHFRTDKRWCVGGAWCPSGGNIPWGNQPTHVRPLPSPPARP